MPSWLPKALTRIRELAAARKVLFKPLLAGTVLYVKLILRNDCIVVSFHEDEGGGHEEEDA